MLGQSFARIVEECLHRLDRGENLPDVLADFPGIEEKLRPLLLVAMASRAMDVPFPNESAKRTGRNQMLAEMDQMASRNYLHEDIGLSRFQNWYHRTLNSLRARNLIQPAPSYRLAVVALMMAFGLGLFAVTASASNLPGGLLGAFSNDVRQALGVFDLGQGEQEPTRPPTFIFSNDDLYFGGRGAAKVAFLLGLNEEEVYIGQGFVYQIEDQDYPEETLDEDPAVSDVTVDTSETSSTSDPDQPADIDVDTNSATTYAPGQQDEPATLFAPGQQDGPATDYAPGQVKKDQDTDDQDTDDEKDKKDKKDKIEKEDKTDDAEEGDSEDN